MQGIERRRLHHVAANAALQRDVPAFEHFDPSARIGADVATMPPAVIRSLFKHVLTDKGIEAFLADWEKTGQSI